MIVAVLLFLVEVIIAVYVHDEFIRPYIGDVLVVILLYYLLTSFLHAPVFEMTVAVLLFSYLVETLQYFNFVGLIGLSDSRLANIVIGNSFAWGDILAYTVGIIIVLAVELGFRKR
ncbi:DUF2809 domain-containing protein [Pedobacter sp. MC2016-24]|uniref:ribosomal maturation YjgA family protein n=1 Tax=Pedobacter sp. MC2016-24 TaxID=2780090 RepID=UPI001D16F901|nr:DUF2809 domain-containing protein [Pedobacter sp. MC2016-24]